jgi:choline-sulfatase
MSEPALSPSPRPWRDGLAAGVGPALVAGAIVALIDAATSGFGALPHLLALWLPVALVIGLVAGLISAGVLATHGDGVVRGGLRRLRDDRELDIALTGAVLAGVIVALILVAFVGVAAKALVADVQRKSTGALLLGVAIVALLPVFALLGYPFYRVTRRLAAFVPAAGSAPRLLVLLALGGVAILALGLFVIFTQLDWQALGLGGHLLALGLIAGTLLLKSIPVLRKPIVAGVGALVAIVLPLVLLRGTPSPSVRDTVVDQSMGGSKLVRVYRAFLDRDHDGQSAFFGGPDCNDGDKTIFNGADEIKDDGIDQNCDGRDRVSKAEEPVKAADPPPTPTKSDAVAKDANVLIVMIDTVRADRLGVAGYQRDGKSLTPRLDAFVQQAAWFTRAYSVAPNTPRAMPAFMTSRYASTIKVDKLFKNYPVVDNANVMLFEVLKDAGYATLGYSSHFYFRDERNFTQGFDLYDNEGALDIAPSNKDIAAPRIVPKVLAKLDELAKDKTKFAMWVHLFEPHSTYMEHDFCPISERGTASLIHKYDCEIQYTDGYVGQILDALDATGLAKNTVVVIVADHGEAFGVHTFAGQKMFFHGQTLYDELLRIPLTVRVPGAAPTKSDAVVSLLDVAPTVLDAVGVAIPPAFQGRSLVPAVTGKPLPPRPVFAELIPYPSWDHEGRAVISGDGRWKLFDRVSDGKKELYDLSADPEEREDRFRAEPQIAQEMEDLLLDFQDLRKAAE